MKRDSATAVVAREAGDRAREVKMGIVVGIVVVGGMKRLGGGWWVWRRKVGMWGLEGGGEKDEKVGRGIWV